MKKIYKISWGEGYTQICANKLEAARIIFELLADQQSVKITLIQNPS